jgi:hypothetical protein
VVPCPDLSDRLATALFQPEIGVPVRPRAADVSLASHQPDRSLIALGRGPLAVPLPDEDELSRRDLQSATRAPPILIGRPEATNATFMSGYRERRRIYRWRAAIGALNPGVPRSGRSRRRDIGAPQVSVHGRVG